MEHDNSRPDVSGNPPAAPADTPQDKSAVAAWLRRNALLLAGLFGELMFQWTLQIGWLSDVPDPLVGVFCGVPLLLFIYGVWHLPTVQKFLRLTYNRSPRMLLTLLITVGAVLGGSIGAFGYWTVKRQQRREAQRNEKQPTVDEFSQPVEVKTDEPKPNLITVSYGKLNIVYDPRTQTFTEADSGIPALVAKFRNAHERGKVITEAKDIRAHINFEPFEFYKTLDRNTPGFAGVSEAIWLNEKNGLVNFTRGETKTLILAVQMPDGGFGGFDAFEHSVKTVNGNELFLPKIPKLTADKYVVKVILTGGADGDLSQLYHFTITLRPEFNISYG